MIDTTATFLAFIVVASAEMSWALSILAIICLAIGESSPVPARPITAVPNSGLPRTPATVARSLTRSAWAAPGASPQTSAASAVTTTKRAVRRRRDEAQGDVDMGSSQA